MRIGNALKQDMRFQFRHGFYYAYLIVSLIYIVILQVLPFEVRKMVTPLIIFSDPTIFGFFFIGGIILLERDQNILENLFVTPLRVGEYFIAKVSSLAILALLVSLVIGIMGVGFQIQWIPTVLGIILSSCFFTLFGFILAVRAKSFNEYIIISPVAMIFCMPTLEYLQIWTTPFFKLSPGWAGLMLIVGGFQGIDSFEMVLAIVNLLIWTALAYWVARQEFHKYIILKIGGGQ